MVRGANQDAIELARLAQAIARPLGLTEVLSDALNSEGLCRPGNWRAVGWPAAPGPRHRAGRAA
jgi:hypothetical protein